VETEGCRPGVSLSIVDVRDKSRSLGFSPGTNFSLPLKPQCLLKDGAEQECSGYIFVPGVRNARAGFMFLAFLLSGEQPSSDKDLRGLKCQV
jgi:hypothetical protein